MLLLLLLLLGLFALDDAGVREILRVVVGVAGSRRAEVEPAPLGVEGTDDVPETSVGRREEGGGRRGREAGQGVGLSSDQAARLRFATFFSWCIPRLAHLCAFGSLAYPLLYAWCCSLPCYLP